MQMYFVFCGFYLYCTAIEVCKFPNLKPLQLTKSCKLCFVECLLTIFVVATEYKFSAFFK
jgi:hypothetical protein